MTVKIDKRIYNDRVITKALYWLSKDFIIIRRTIDAYTEEVGSSAINQDNDDEFEQKFFYLLNDFKMRQIITDETRDIKTILYARAFSEDDDLNTDDIHD